MMKLWVPLGINAPYFTVMLDMKSHKGNLSIKSFESLTDMVITMIFFLFEVTTFFTQFYLLKHTTIVIIISV